MVSKEKSQSLVKSPLDLGQDEVMAEQSRPELLVRASSAL